MCSASNLVVQAMQAGDPELMRQAQLNIAQRRMGIKTPVGATPGTMGVPGTSILRSALPRATPGATPAWGATPGTAAGALHSRSPVVHIPRA